MDNTRCACVGGSLVTVVIERYRSEVARVALEGLGEDVAGGGLNQKVFVVSQTTVAILAVDSAAVGESKSPGRTKHGGSRMTLRVRNVAANNEYRADGWRQQGLAVFELLLVVSAANCVAHFLFVVEM